MKRICIAVVLLLLLLLLPAAGFSANAKTYEVKSPSGKLTLGLSVGEQCEWTLDVNGERVITDSRIALDLGDRVLGHNARVKKVSKGSRAETIEAPFYRQACFATRYNYLALSMKDGWALECRAYDDGVAYRFVTSFKTDVRVKNETAEFNFADTYGMLVPYVHKRTDGDRYRSSFENLYAAVPVGDVTTADGRLAFMPVYIDLGEKGRLLLMESDLWDYPGMFLNTTKSGFVAEFPPYPNDTQVQDAKYLDYLADVKGTRTYPWRVIAYGEDETALPTNNMVYQLATPRRIEDISWIVPGQSSWDWWNAFRLHGVDFKAGINTESYLYDIDFAAKYGIPYVLVDEGWYKKGNMFNVIPEMDIPALCRHAAEKGVKLMLWVSKGVLGLNPEKAFKHYSRMGVAGFKIDFFDSQEAAMVARINMYAAIAAKYKLVLDFHGIFKPVGLNRTYPNVLNFEGVFGLENLKWCNPERCDMPRNDVILPYVRQAAGQMDYTPGALRNARKKDFRAVNSKPMSMGTRAHQLACYVVFDSPLEMLCDSPSDYIKEDETTRWITSIPTVFERTVVLSGKIGEWIVTAREKDGNWYVGGLTSWTGRDIEVDLSVLPSGKWHYRLFKDGANADTVGEDYAVTEGFVESGGRKTVRMAPGGGFVMILNKE